MPTEACMKKVLTLLALASAIACQQYDSSPWFEGDFESARAKAEAEETVVMIEFYAEWCSWCKRLEKETFSRNDVRRELGSLVAMKVDAEKEGIELAERFQVDSYPTMVFVEADGTEIDRIVGYLPPESFLERVAKVRTGDTFLACLRELDEDPGSVDAIARAVDGLLERSDPIGAISRLEAFHQATGEDELALCKKLMFAARAELHERIYQRAAKLYRRGWYRAFEVPETEGTRALNELIQGELFELSADEQADRLRAARFEDARVLLEIPDARIDAAGDLFIIGNFAYRSGHYDEAARLYRQWYEKIGAEATPEDLNDVAWRLYLARQELELAIEIAQRAYAASPDPDTTDTLARLLYIEGATDEAIALERKAAEGAEGPRRETFQAVVSQMEAGEVLDDRPSFERYPGTRRDSL
jgi:thioredoxin-related protein